MSYSFRHDDATVGEGLRRIATLQLDRAVAALEDRGALHAGVHDARKRVKKLRGLLRLVRPVLPGFKAENAALRDAARTLSDLRDHAALIETLDRLAERHPGRADRRRLQPFRREIEARRDAAARANDLADRIEAFRSALAEARKRAAEWDLRAEGWKAIGPGVASIYAEGREAMALAHKTGRGEDFHEWRKRVKDHGYHARLLKGVFPAAIEPHAALFSDLGEVLGEQHDLVTLAPVLAASGLGTAERVPLEDLVAEERVALETRALALGARLYAERPKDLARRWGAWWKMARAEAEAGQADAKSPASAASISAMLSAIP